MKRPLLLMLLLCAMITGCKKSSTQPDEVTATIVGKWYIKTLVNTGGINQGTFTAFTDQDTYIFSADNVVNISNSGQGITAVMNYTYSKAPAQQVVISNSDRADTYSIIKLTTDSLVMRNTLSTVFGQPLMTNNTPLYRLARK